MIYHQHIIEEKKCDLIPIGDIHIGDRAFGKLGQYKLRENIEKTRKNPYARVLLMGDIFNCSTRHSKTSPYEQVYEQEFDTAIKYFEPIKDKIIGALDGNHEDRLIDFANFSILNAFCKALKIPYLGTSVALETKVGTKDKQRRGTVSYKIYAHHTTGGGATPGSKLNRTEKLRDLLAGADIYLGAHNHQLHAARVQENYMDTHSKSILTKDQWLIGTGSYLEWDGSYAEKKQLAPAHLGSPIITLFGRGTRDIQVTL